MSTLKSLRRTDSEGEIRRWRSVAFLFFGGAIGVLTAWLPGHNLLGGEKFLVALLCLLSGSLSWLVGSISQRQSARADEKIDEIDTLYQEIRSLQEKEADQPDLIWQIENKLTRLRELQRAEAATMRKRFEASFDLPPGVGLSALRDARRLLGRDENPASANSPSLQKD